MTKEKIIGALNTIIAADGIMRLDSIDLGGALPKLVTHLLGQDQRPAFALRQTP